MAIYHLEGKIISRSQGRSSVAAAAYRSGSRIKDKRTGITHDFTQKSHDILHSEILLPKGAPEWMADRDTLWNHVEQVEKRKDAQLAREFVIALPKELTSEQNLKLAKEFVQREFVDLGMVADVCLHRGHSKDDKGQPHMHVMLSLREVTKDGFGKKVREWNDKALMNHWREAWANTCNQHLARAGFDVRIDHRSYEAQGIDIEPQSKIGPKDAKARMARFAEHQELAERNGKRILKNPMIAFDAITKQQSTFTLEELACFVSRNSATAEQFTQVYEVLKASPELVLLGKDNKGQERFTSQTMLRIEKALVDQALAKVATHNHLVSARIQKKALNSKSLSAEQKEAFYHLMNSGDIAALVGFAGTGKSYMLGAAKDAWEAAGYTVKGMTLSGIAAENLEASSGIQSQTIARAAYYWEQDRARLTSSDIVVIDEAGMVDSRQLEMIMQEVTRAGAKVVLIGDPEQLQAIGAGAAFRAILERIGFAQMNDVRRQKDTWQQVATRQLALQKTDQAILAYTRYGHVHVDTTIENGMKTLIEHWHETRSNEPKKSHLILAYTRKDVKTLNELARLALKDNGELGRDTVLQTARGERAFAKGDKIYFLRNDYQMGVKNGTLGTIKSISGQQLTVQLHDTEGKGKGEKVTFHLSDYDEIDHGYAATIHKAQGVTVDRSFVWASRQYDRHTTYVALTRHRESAELYRATDNFRDINHLIQMLSRERTKDFTLDYTERRGLTTLTQAYEAARMKSYDFEEKMYQEQGAMLDAKAMAAVRVDSNYVFSHHYKNSFEANIKTFIQDGTGEDIAKLYKAVLDSCKTLQEKGGSQFDLRIEQLEMFAKTLYQHPEKFQAVKAIKPKLSKLIKTRAKAVIAEDKEKERLKQGQTGKLVNQYKDLIKLCKETNDSQQLEKHLHELDSMAKAIYLNSSQLDKIEKIAPKLSRLIKIRAKEALSREQDWDIER